MGIIDFIKSLFGIQSDDDGYQPFENAEEKENSSPPPLTDEIVKQIAESIPKVKKPKDRVYFFIVGTYYRGSDAMLRRDLLQDGEKLRLKKDKRNRYSSTALRVYTLDGVWIGFVDDGHSSRIWKDMDGDECEAEFSKCIIGDDQIWFDDENIMHEKHYDGDDDWIAFYTIPFYEEKQKELILKRQESKAIKDLQTPEGRMEPEDIDYLSLSKDELQKRKKSIESKLKSRRKKGDEIPPEGPIKELHDIQIANLEKALQLINSALKSQNN